MSSTSISLQGDQSSTECGKAHYGFIYLKEIVARLKTTKNKMLTYLGVMKRFFVFHNLGYFRYS